MKNTNANMVMVCLISIMVPDMVCMYVYLCVYTTMLTLQFYLTI